MGSLSSVQKLIKNYWPFLPLCLGVFIAADDQTVVVTLLPDMLIDLDVSVYDLDRGSWTITGYLIGFTAAMPLVGRFSDRYGHRLVFVVAMIVFMLGSVLVAVSPEIPRIYGSLEPDLRWTIGTRIFQAIGGGAVIPIAIASAGDLLPRYRHAIAFGLVGASAEAGGVLGPLWGGLAVQYLSWEWAFWLNLPLGALVIVLIMATPKGVRRPVEIDLVAGGLFAASLTLLTTGLLYVGDRGTESIVLLICAALTSLVLLIWISRARAPLFPKSLLMSGRFIAANCSHLIVGSALIIAMITVPLMADTVLGTTALEGGLRLLRLTVAIPIGALIGGMLTQRFNARGAGISGALLVALGFAFMSRWDLNVSDPWMTVHLLSTGLGFGLLISPITSSALQSAGEGERGVAAALVTVSRMVGMTVGLAAIASWGTTRFDILVSGAPPLTDDPVTQRQIAVIATDAGLTVFRGFFSAGFGLALLALIPLFLMGRQRKIR